MNSIYFIFLAGIVLLFGKENNASQNYGQHHPNLSQPLCQHFFRAEYQPVALFYGDDLSDSNAEIESEAQLFFIRQISDPSSGYCLYSTHFQRQLLLPLIYDLPPPVNC